MSCRSSSDVENEPHAYVAYWEGEKETVPLKFVFEFPSLWRTEGWDDNKLYKVFWSPDENDSPTKMLKRVPEIPVHEKGSSLEKPGYYRAAVVKVKESLQELEEAMANKRTSVGLMRYKYTSFEKKPEQTRSKRKADTIKLKKSKKNTSKGNSGSKKKKGLNISAQIDNTSELKNDLASRFPHLVVSNKDNPDNVDKYLPPVQPSDPDQHQHQNDTNDTKGINLVSRHSAFQSKSESGQSSEESSSLASTENNSNDEGDRNGSKSASEGDSHLVRQKAITPSGSKVPRACRSSSMKRTTSSKKGKRRLLSTSSPSTDSDGHGKRYKYDLDFTPRRYELLKDKVAVQKRTIDRIMNLNLKLQTDRNELEKKNYDLERKIERLQGKTDYCPTKSTHLPIENPSAPQQSLYVLRTEPLVKRQLDIKGILPLTKDELKPDAVSVSNFHEGQDVIDVSSLCETIISSPVNESKYKLQEGSEPDFLKSEDEQCSDVNGIIATASDENGNKKKTPPVSDEEKSKASDNTNDKNVKEEPAAEIDLQKDLVDICGVKIPRSIKEAICSIPEGEKRDLRFIKDLSTAVFGPEVLASHSVSGTLKGGKKQPAGALPKVKRPALCKETLKALRDELIKRVEREEKTELKEPDTHKRTLKKRFHDAIFDVQKKLRGWGYGTGEKANTLTQDIFK